MSSVLSVLLLGINLLTIGYATLVVGLLAFRDLHSRGDRLIGFGLLATALVTLQGLLLGYTGILSRGSIFLSSLFIGLAAWGVASRRRLSTRQMLRETAGSARRWFSRLTRTQQVILVVIVLITESLLMIALFTPPADYDSLGYRLGRIGWWLQEGEIWHAPTPDERMNYSPLNGDLVMLWLTSPFSVGFPLVKLVQFISGLYLLAVTAVFAKRLGARSDGQFAAVLLVMSMPVFLAQMRTSQVDLFSAAMGLAGIYFLFQSLRGKGSPWLAWIGLALALGAKGTLFYWGPGLLLFGVGLLLLFRPPANNLLRQSLAAAICLSVFAAPRYVENLFHFGNPFAPEDLIEYHHGAADPVAGLGEKISLNTQSYLAQVLSEPDNLPPLGWLLRPLSDALIASLPEEADPYVVGPGRGQFLPVLYQDAASFSYALRGSSGALVWIMGGLGFLIAASSGLRHRRKRSLIPVLCFCSVGLFLGCFIALSAWTPNKLRYFLVAYPLIALVGGWWVGTWRQPWRRGALIALTLVATGIAFKVLFMDRGNGIRLLRGEVNSVQQSVTEAQRRMLQEEVRPGAKLIVSGHLYGFTKAFFRNGLSLETQLIHLDELDQFKSAAEVLASFDADYLIAPASRFTMVEPSIFKRYFREVPAAHRAQGFTLHRRMADDEHFAGLVHDYEFRRGRTRVQHRYTIQTFKPLSHLAIETEILQPQPIELTVWREGQERRWRIQLNQPVSGALSVPIELNAEDTATIIIEVRFDRDTRVSDQHAATFTFDDFIPLLELE